MQAINNKIIVKPSEFKNRTASGIILPTINREQYIEGIAISVGHKIENIKEGDKIFYDKNAMLDIDYKHEGEKTYMVRGDIDVIAIIE